MRSSLGGRFWFGDLPKADLGAGLQSTSTASNWGRPDSATGSSVRGNCGFRDS